MKEGYFSSDVFSKIGKKFKAGLMKAWTSQYPCLSKEQEQSYLNAIQVSLFIKHEKIRKNKFLKYVII